ncbi:glycosyl hydrolase family 61-domain-containing protein [Daedaleopsis nitida]|nr:glycosyl hydrolase family 61-domain-containing protein [Daedaleopsis nitida]
MKATFSILASLVAAASSVSARTVFSAITVDGVALGHDVAVRVPTSNVPVTDLTSNDIICNTNFVQPVSDVVASVPAGGVVTAEFHRTSAGYIGPDPADPLDPTNKGPVIAYLAKVPDATQEQVTGLEWFKVFEQGLNSATHQWGSDFLFLNNGFVNVTIPSCVEAGQYLLRVESISLSSATQYPGAQFFMSCAQLEVTGGGNASPETVSLPGAYTPTSPGIVTNIYTVDTYTPPGPAVFQC